RAVLRRVDENTQQIYEDDQLTIEFAEMQVKCGGLKVRLANKEFKLLATLAKSPGRVLTRQQLLDEVWGYNYYGDARTLDVHIRKLRQKLGPCGDCIETMIGVGYRFTGCAAQSTRAGDLDSER
ncbi:MAG TPA: winged helix-turn-helix domain-containing protein, partial [Pyrinomonadaceae bacterium]|nr:winged helix-turn-helix domain-containing protein [Pyrinomonadaceae bacterium]